MLPEEEKKVMHMRKEITKLVKKTDYRKLKLIYQYIKALMA